MKPLSRFLQIFLCALLSVPTALPASAASYHWVDSGGFHSVGSLDKVPLERRKHLPMARNGVSLPFTAEEDRDGAMYVWYILGRAGVEYPYIRARDFPKSSYFTRVQEPLPGDVAWWKGFAALFRGNGKLSTAQGEKILGSFEKTRGKPAWYRCISSAVPPTPVTAKAPSAALKKADRSLAGLGKASTFPPDVSTDAERQSVGMEWGKVIAGLEKLAKGYPDDPQVLRRLGVCYRMGYNLDVAGAWEKAEAYLLRTEELLPEAPEAYISLGILYADSSRAELAEKQFRAALPKARKEQLAQIWWGLALALHYQGRTSEALEEIDRLLGRHPEDARAIKLRDTILQEKRGK